MAGLPSGTIALVPSCSMSMTRPSDCFATKCVVMELPVVVLHVLVDNVIVKELEASEGCVELFKPSMAAM
jgi:hypothetical protein